MIRIAIAGKGRMGQAVAAIVDANDDLELAGAWGRGEDLDPLVDSADVVIDFSLPEGTDEVLGSVARLRKPLVCGVSGLTARTMERLGEVAEHVPLVYDRNMSLGIAVLEQIVRDAAAALGEGFEVAIEEVHHVHKKDAPSGTALQLGEAISDASGVTGPVEIHSERQGDVPGDHRVVFSSPSESLTFEHSVTTRQVFADGAVRAARWIRGRPEGLYRMRDVLFGIDPQSGA